MPNWCSNNLTIYGPKQDRDRLLEAATNDKGVLAFCENLIPMPDGMIEHRPMPDGSTVGVFVNGGAEWQYDNWGTKWGDCRTDILVKDDLYTTVTYETPWGPITRTWLAISEQYPTLVFVEQYDEPGMCFLGGNRIANGKVIAEKHIDETEYPSMGEYIVDGEEDTDAYYDAVDMIREKVETAVDLSLFEVRGIAGIEGEANV